MQTNITSGDPSTRNRSVADREFRIYDKLSFSQICIRTCKIWHPLSI